MMKRSMSASASPASRSQQLDAGADRGLGELHRAHVVLGEVHARRQQRGALAVVRAHVRMPAAMRPRASMMPACTQHGQRVEHARAAQPDRLLARRWSATTMRPSRSATRSIAPSAARMPQEMWPPSSAGPEGQEADRMRPPWISEISVLVPMSITSAVRTPLPAFLGGQQRGHVVAADEAADVGRQVHVRARRDRQAKIARLARPSLARTAATNGARPSCRTGSPSSR